MLDKLFICLAFLVTVLLVLTAVALPCSGVAVWLDEDRYGWAAVWSRRLLGMLVASEAVFLTACLFLTGNGIVAFLAWQVFGPLVLLKGFKDS